MAFHWHRCYSQSCSCTTFVESVMPSADPNASSRIPAAHLGGFGTPGASFSYSYSNGFLRDASPSQHTNTQASRRTYAALGSDVPRVSPFPDMSGVPPAGNAQFTIHDAYSMASTLQTGQVVPQHSNTPQVTTTILLQQSPGGHRIIVQDDYACGQNTIYSLLSPTCPYDHFSLHSAHNKHFDSLSRSDQSAFPDITFGQKIGIRLRVTDHPPYDHQMTVPRPHRPCPSRSALASLIAREFQRFLDREKNEGRVLRYLGKEVTLQNLALLEVKHVSRASVQPVICLVGL